MSRSTRIVGGVAVFGVAVTAAWEASSWPHVFVAPHLDLVLETMAGTASLLVAFLLFGRFRMERRLVDLALVCSLAMLGAAHLGYQVAPVVVADEGHTAFAAWAAMVSHVSAGLVFAAAAFVGDRTVRHRAAVEWGAACVVLLVLAGVGAALFAPPGAPEAARTSAGTVINLIGATAFFGVAFLFAERSRRADDGLLMWVAVATMLAAIGRLNYVIHPTLYTSGVGLGDVFRLADHVALVIGGMLEIRRLWRGLGAAAVAEERRRIARDWHDGVAQEFAFISRRSADLPPEVADAARRGLTDTRRAIAALREPGESGEDLATALRSAAERAARGTRAAVAVDLAPGLRLDAGEIEELARIVGEAVSNAIRHGGATQVSVSRQGRRIIVHDDGQGFDPQAVRPGSYGLAGMRERAARMGGNLELRSGPGGTEVEVVLP